MKLARFVSLLLVGSLMMSTSPIGFPQPTKAEEVNPLKIEKIIGLSKEPGTFRKANGLAVAKDGTIFIGDTGESQIEVYDANFKYIRTIGSLGNGEDQFQWIQSIHLDEDENLYVLDRFLGCIKVFSKEGKFLRKIGNKGYQEENLDSPIDFAFLSSKEIIIADYSEGIKVFSKEGTYINKFENQDIDDFALIYAYCVSVDEKGYIYVIDTTPEKENRKYFKFDKGGSYLCEFLVDEKYQDNQYGPFQLAFAGKTLFLSDNVSIQKYEISEDPSTPVSFIETMVEESSGDDFNDTTIIECSSLFSTDSKLYYLDSTINRLVVLSNHKESLGIIQSSIKEKGSLYLDDQIPKNVLAKPMGITIGPDGLFYVANANFNKISIFDSKWEEIDSFGKLFYDRKKQIGELMHPIDVAVNKDGFKFVSDSDGEYNFESKYGTVEVFNKENQPFMTVKISSGVPMGIDFDSFGNLVVSKRFRDGIEIYDVSKVAEKKIIKRKTFQTPSYQYVHDVAVDSQDNMIASYWLFGNLVWINPKGEIYQSVGDFEDPANNYLSLPRGLCVDEKNDIFVVDLYEGIINKVSKEAKLIWQSPLNWCGFSYMTRDSQGKLYVTDMFHNVILVLSDETAVPPVPKEPTTDESNASFSFSVEKPDITEQEAFTLSVKVDKLEHTAAIDLTIQYPKELLSFESCTLGDVLIDPVFGVPIIDQSTGFINIKSSSMDGKETAGSGVLFEVKLKAKRPGLAFLEFADIKLKNAEGNKVSYAGKKALSLVIKARDTTPPPLTIKPCPSEVYDPILLIEGETEPGARVTINQKEVTVGEDGKFSSKQELAKGSNTFLVEAVDKAGNKSNQTILVTLKDKIIIELTIGSQEMTTNGKPIQLDVPPFIDKVSGRTMVPIRAISGAIGAKIEFSQDVRTISITLGTISVELRIGNPKALVNGVEVPIDSDGKVTPVIVKGRTFVPLRFVAETFEFKVEWDAKTQKITLTYPKELFLTYIKV